MNYKLRKTVTLVMIFSALFILVDGKAQNIQRQNSSPRIRDNFDASWQFHQGDIAIRHAIKAGGYGGLTDVNVKVETNKEAIIAYTDVDKAATFKPEDWKE